MRTDCRPLTTECRGRLRFQTAPSDENKVSPAEVQVFIGMPVVVASPAMRNLLRTVERVARADAAVLITGESGAGKEAIARAIHHYSLRCNKAWVDLSCAALPDHLVESELFGYERGAFSGADTTKQGLFELAAGGSIFMDEIGELDPRMQVKLLRVLDGVPYYRLGGTRKVPVNARVIAATNQDLEAAMRDGRFRRDLYHRLTQVHLVVPPLRERREDILPLAEFFLDRQRPGMRLSEAGCRALESAEWPGNVRELRNVVIQAAVMAEGDVLEVADLGLPQPEAPENTGMTLIVGMERQMILEVLSRTGGHHGKAAGLLGISTRTLSRKLKVYEQSALRTA